jgi:hypothetical protein
MCCSAKASKQYMKKTIAMLALAAVGIATVNAGVNFGVSVGIPVTAPVVVAPALVIMPPMPAPIVEAVPVCPTPGYVWVGGSWGWCNNRWVWTRGHWGAPAHWGYYHGYHGGYHGHR